MLESLRIGRPPLLPLDVRRADPLGDAGEPGFKRKANRDDRSSEGGRAELRSVSDDM
jgi:hypothetical protein